MIPEKMACWRKEAHEESRDPVCAANKRGKCVIHEFEGL